MHGHSLDGLSIESCWVAAQAYLTIALPMVTAAGSYVVMGEVEGLGKVITHVGQMVVLVVASDV